jgi:hypothetical protein
MGAVIARECGRSSIPETEVLDPRGRSVLGHPVKPGDGTEKNRRGFTAA